MERALYVLEWAVDAFRSHRYYVGFLAILVFLMLLYDGFMLIHVITTWIPSIRGSKFYNFFEKGTNAFLRPFTNWIVIGSIDFTTIIGFLIFNAATNGLITYINYLIGA